MRDRLPTLAIAVLLLFAPAASTIAQVATPVAVGDRVRVFTAGHARPLIRRVVGVQSDTLLLGQRGGGAPQAVPFGSVTRLDRSSGAGFCGHARRVGCVLGGTVLGAVVGGIVGNVATQCSGCEDPGIGALAGIPVGGLLGLIVGAVVGGERWERVQVRGRS
jgi:hypothetical protein